MDQEKKRLIQINEKKRKEFKQMVADMFVKSLEEKQLDWKKGWNAGFSLPVNAISGKSYHGINSFYLNLCALKESNWNPEQMDNRWATFKQIKEKGWRLKNAKGTGRKVEFWSPYDTKEHRNLGWNEYNLRKHEKDVILIFNVYVVFNGKYIEGIPELDRSDKGRIILDDPLISKIASGMGVSITNDGGDRAFYRENDDSIHLPLKEAFLDSYEYNATALHELSHATGAKHRLNRFPSSREMDAVAYEELVAEISACFMSEYLEIPYSDKHMDNHKAYIQSWIQQIIDKPAFLSGAITDAKLAANHLEIHAGILQKEETQEAPEEMVDLEELEDKPKPTLNDSPSLFSAETPSETEIPSPIQEKTPDPPLKGAALRNQILEKSANPLKETELRTLIKAWRQAYVDAEGLYAEPEVFYQVLKNCVKEVEQAEKENAGANIKSLSLSDCRLWYKQGLKAERYQPLREEELKQFLWSCKQEFIGDCLPEFFEADLFYRAVEQRADELKEAEMALENSVSGYISSLKQQETGNRMEYTVGLINGDFIYLDAMDIYESQYYGQEELLDRNGDGIYYNYSDKFKLCSASSDEQRRIIDAIEEKIQEHISIIHGNKYDIAVSMDELDNRCTIHFLNYSYKNDPDVGEVKIYESTPDCDKKMIELYGDQFNVHFPSLKKSEIRKIIDDYMKEQELIRDSISALPGDTVAYYVPSYNSEKGFKEIDGLKKITGKLVEKTENEYHVSTSKGIKKLKVEEIYNCDQIRVIENALSDYMPGEFLDLLGQPKLSADQMEQILQGYKEGLNFYQLAMYASPNCEVWQMEVYRYGMYNNISPYTIKEYLIDNPLSNHDLIGKRSENEVNKEFAKNAIDDLVKLQRNQIIKDIKANHLLPEKKLVHNIEKLNGITMRQYTVKRILEEKTDINIPNFREIKSEICRTIDYQRKRKRFLEVQPADRVLAR